jgi:hypothetical protein
LQSSVPHLSSLLSIILLLAGVAVLVVAAAMENTVPVQNSAKDQARESKFRKKAIFALPLMLGIIMMMVAMSPTHTRSYADSLFDRRLKGESLDPPVGSSSKCGGAVNTGGTANGKCTSDLWGPTDDTSMHCYAYGGPSDKCAIHNNNDADDGLSKNPSGCDKGTFYLWDEVSTVVNPESMWRLVPSLYSHASFFGYTARYAGGKLYLGGYRVGCICIAFCI